MTEDFQQKENLNCKIILSSVFESRLKTNVHCQQIVKAAQLLFTIKVKMKCFPILVIKIEC